MTAATIRDATPADLDAVLDMHRRAFGQDEEADLVRALLADPTATPCLSLLATDGDTALGHILFTAVTVEGAAHMPARILCPLAVAPDAQAKGVGRALVEAGLERLRAENADLVFVLGDPAYYGRFGFEPAGARGLATPHEIPAAYDDAWRVLKLGGGHDVSGRVRCADVLNQPHYWRE